MRPDLCRLAHFAFAFHNAPNDRQLARPEQSQEPQKVFEMSQLQAQDPELFASIAAEQERQRDGLELIASENYTCRAVM